MPTLEDYNRAALRNLTDVRHIRHGAVSGGSGPFAALMYVRGRHHPEIAFVCLGTPQECDDEARKMADENGVPIATPMLSGSHV